MKKLTVDNQKMINGGFNFYIPLLSPSLTNNIMINFLINKWFK